MTDERWLRARLRAIPAAPMTAALIAMGTFALTRLGVMLLRDAPAHGMVFWPTAAVGMVLLIRTRRATWAWSMLGITAGIAAASLLHGRSLATSASFAAANAVEMAVAASAVLGVTGIALRVDGQGGPLLRDWRNTLVMAGAGALGVVAGAVILASTHGSTPGTWWHAVARYAAGHLVGLLVVAPLLLSVPRTRAEWRRVVRDRAANVEWLALLLVALGVTGALFLTTVDRSVSFVVLVPLLVAAERLRPIRATTVLAAVCVLAALGTVHGSGPFARVYDPRTRLVMLQCTLAGYCVLTLVAVFLAGVRRRAHAMRRDSQLMMTSAFDHAPTGMYIASLDPTDIGRLIYVNEALATLVRRPAAELVGRHVRALSPADEQPAAEPVDGDGNGENSSAEHYHRDRVLLRADGRRIPTAHAVRVIRPERGHPYLIAQITDLRDRVEAERAMTAALHAEATAAAELRRVNDARVAVAARLAHDLRSPLTVARAYQELVGTGAAGDLSDEQRQMIEISLGNTDKVIDLVDALVKAASVELERIDVKQRTVLTVGEVLVSAMSGMGPEWERRGQTLGVAEEHLDVEILVDAVQLERAVANVLSNAIRYTPDGGRIDVSVTLEDDGVAIAVTDTGIGVDAAQLHRLGDQFFRADTADVHAIKGVGLGLAVTKAVLAKHGGWLSVESAVGVGSTFVLRVPRGRPAIEHDATTAGRSLEWAPLAEHKIRASA